MIIVSSATGIPMYQFDMDNYQRHWKRNSNVTEVIGVYDNAPAKQQQGIIQHAIKASANFDPGKMTLKSFYYGGKRQNRTKKQAEALAVLWRQAAKEKIMEINNNIYNTWKGLQTSDDFPDTLSVLPEGTVSVPVEDWKLYKKLIKNQLNRIK